MHKGRETSLKDWAVAGLAGLVLVAAFALIPLPGGDDWQLFSAASRRVWTGEPLYGEEVSTHYYNPPWLAVALSPLSLLPHRLGWALLSVASLIAMAAVAHRYGGGLARIVLVILSPSAIYTLLHGQIDALILAAILLPQEWWMIAGLTKPQVAFGLILGIPRPKWVRALLLTGLLLVATLIWFGNWPLQLIRQPTPNRYDGYNLWLGLWPFQVPIGILLILLGISRKDERWLVSASPFLFPYAAISSLLGPWVVACTLLTNWQAAIVLLSWWAAVIFRMLVGV